MKAKLMMALMYRDEETLIACKKKLIELYGEIEQEGSPYNFNYTNYYEEEFGTNLKKQFIIFKKEIEIDELATLKHESTEIEKKFIQDNKRTINIDPGYLTEKELTLASFKERKDVKEDIGQGVFSHTVIDNRTETFGHTFKDYRDHLKFFFPEK